MSSRDEFETIEAHTSSEIPKIKGSRFIADAFPVATESAARAALESVIARYPDATHHCQAFRLEDGGLERSSDDGEPSGTAGPPILRQIHSSGLSDVLVVVTRYYGGTKLGAGGLIRAYGAAARQVLGECRRVTRVVETLLTLTFDYEDTSAAMRTIERFGARIVESAYTERSTLEILIRASSAESFQTEFRDALGGRGRIHESTVL